MPQVIHPSDLAQKVLALEAPGGAPQRLLLAIPSVAAVGDPLKVHAAVLDAGGLPSLQCNQSLILRCDAARPSEFRVKFQRGQPAAVSVIDGPAIAAEGLYRIAGELDGLRGWSNPVCVQQRPARRLFWGDPHVHTLLGRCHPERCRSINFAYACGRYVTGLDWMSTADHVSNGRCSYSVWQDQRRTFDLYDDPPAFATLPAYEASLQGGRGGDVNVYMYQTPDDYVDEYEEGNLRTLCEKLAEQVPEAAFFVVPHHTTRAGKHGEIPPEIYPGESRMPAVEIHSKWGTSEYRGNPDPLKEVHAGPAMVVDLLNRGYCLGFIGGTDSHASITHWVDCEPNHIQAPPGMTAVRADKLSRRDVFEAIHRRDCYAVKGERIYMDVTIAGAQPGEKIRWDDTARPREVTVTAAAPTALSSVDLVRNGETIDSVTVDNWQGECRFVDETPLKDALLVSHDDRQFAYYYVRINGATGAQAWSSPVWLDHA